MTYVCIILNILNLILIEFNMINIIPWLLNLSYHNYDIIFPYIIILKYRYAAKNIIIS